MSIAQVGQQHFKIYDSSKKDMVDLEDLASNLSRFQISIFGEEHNDSVAHYLQDTLYRLLIQKQGKVTLSMEMFERDNQQVLNEYLAGWITEPLLIKEGRAWKNHKDYRPLLLTALETGQQVIAANSPRRYVNRVSRLGLESLSVLPKSAKQYFAKIPIDTVNNAYAKKFREAMGGHGSANAYYAQVLWDATMAESIYEGWKKDRKTSIFHLNGRFHSDEKLGTVSQLRKLNNNLKIGTISCFPADDFTDPNWNDYQHLADFIILTDPLIPKSY